MSVFTSGTQVRDGRTVNHDPLPEVNPDGSRASFGRGRPTYEPGPFGRIIDKVLWDPRPEFAVLDNPILADFRATLAACGGLSKHLAENWINLLEDDPTMSDVFVWDPLRNLVPEQIDHARRVLTKLAAVS